MANKKDTSAVGYVEVLSTTVEQDVIETLKAVTGSFVGAKLIYDSPAEAKQGNDDYIQNGNPDNVIPDRDVQYFAITVTKVGTTV